MDEEKKTRLKQLGKLERELEELIRVLDDKLTQTRTLLKDLKNEQDEQTEEEAE